MSMQEVMDPQTHGSGDDWTWDGQAWIMRPIHFPQRPRPPFPPFPPCPPFPSRPINGPIAGVTTGAAARPGEVGEYIAGQQTVSVAINAGVQTLLAQPLVLPPGDWDVQASMQEISFAATDAGFSLHPVPPGVGFMTGFLSLGGVGLGGTPVAGVSLTANRAQALITIPTLLPFTVNITNATLAGSAFVFVTARRMR